MRSIIRLYGITIIFIFICGIVQAQQDTHKIAQHLLKNLADEYQFLGNGIYVSSLVNQTYYRSDQELTEANKTQGMHLFDNQTFTVNEYYTDSLFYQDRTGSDTLIPPSGDMSNRFAMFRDDKVCITPQMTLRYMVSGNGAVINQTKEFNPIQLHKGTSVIRALHFIQSQSPEFLLTIVKSDKYNVIVETMPENQTKISIVSKLNPDKAQRYELVFTLKHEEQVLQSCIVKNGDVTSWEKTLTYDENAKLKECKIVQYDVSSDNSKITSRKSQETSILINELEFTNEKDYSIIGLLNNLPDGTLIEDQIQAVVFKKGEPETLETIAEIEKRTKDAIANGTILRPQN